MRGLIFAALALMAIAGPAAAATDLTGSTVTVQLYYPNDSTPYAGGSAVTTAVGPGVEVGPGTLVAGRPWTFDIGPGSILFEPNETLCCYDNAQPFNGWELSFTGLTKNIASVTLDPSSTFAPTSLYRVGNTVFLNYKGGSPVNGQFALFNVTLVPEPSTWAMMLVGLLGLGAALRLSRRRSAVAATA